MNFHVLTVFPEMIEHASRFGVVGQAIKDGRLKVTALSPRVFTSNVHQTIDDRPFGGGDGMIMMAEPMAQALDVLLASASASRRVIHLSPRGRPFSDELARELTSYEDIILIASRYGGLDQRLLNTYVDEEISIGDYVLSGGELPALTVIDAVGRCLPGVLGNERSAHDESFAPEHGILEHPQYTRPREWRGAEIPQALLSGHHLQIEAWKRELSILVTAQTRPELLREHSSRAELQAALKRLRAMPETERKVCGLKPDLDEALTALLEAMK